MFYAKFIWEILFQNYFYTNIFPGLSETILSTVDMFYVTVICVINIYNGCAEILGYSLKSGNQQKSHYVHARNQGWLTFIFRQIKKYILFFILLMGLLDQRNMYVKYYIGIICVDHSLKSNCQSILFTVLLKYI